MDPHFRCCPDCWPGLDARLRLTQQLLTFRKEANRAIRARGTTVSRPWSDTIFLVGTMMEIVLPGLPIQVAFASVAVIGYLVGRLQRSGGGQPSDATRRELKRARAIVSDLGQIHHRVRRELAQHHNSLAAFKQRVGELSQTAASGDWKQLCDEAERLLKPTQDLA